jgi:hypothetical protein
MTDDDKREIARLEQVNEHLEDSLQRCRELLNDYRSKLAANVNDAPAADANGHSQNDQGRL